MNVLFDVVVPVKYGKTDSELKKIIGEEFKMYDSKINVVLEIDKNYNGGK